VIVALVVIAIQGCAVTPPQAPFEQAGTSQRIVVAPARYDPESNFSTFARGYLTGAGKGAAEGAATGAIAGGVSSLMLGPFAPLVAPFLIAGGAAIGGVGGSAYGAAKSVPEQDAKAIDRMLNGAVAGLRLQEAMGKATVTAASTFTPYRAELAMDIGPVSKSESPDYHSLQGRGIGTVIEVRVVQLGFEGGGGKDPEISFFLTAEARMIDTVNSKATWARGLAYQSPEFRASRWAEREGALLRLELIRAYVTLAERIVESFMLGAGFSPRTTMGPWPAHDFVCGLVPTEPKLEWEGNWLEHTLRPARAEVGSYKPTVAWQTFPPADMARKEPDLRTAQEVRYDLRIWREVGGAAEELVYERLALVTPRHTLETALAPSTGYLWSVRPRFTLAGKPRAWRWSASDERWPDVEQQVQDAVYFGSPWDERRYGELLIGALSGGRVPQAGKGDFTPCRYLDFIPPPNYFRFRTPPM